MLCVTRHNVDYGLKQRPNYRETSVREEKGRLWLSECSNPELGVFSWHAKKTSATGTIAYLSQVQNAEKPESMP